MTFSLVTLLYPVHLAPVHLVLVHERTCSLRLLHGRNRRPAGPSSGPPHLGTSLRISAAPRRLWSAAARMQRAGRWAARAETGGEQRHFWAPLPPPRGSRFGIVACALLWRASSKSSPLSPTPTLASSPAPAHTPRGRKVVMKKHIPQPAGTLFFRRSYLSPNAWRHIPATQCPHCPVVCFCIVTLFSIQQNFQ